MAKTGKSGLTAGKGGGRSPTINVNVTNGTPKQIAWANNILQSPMDRILFASKSIEKNAVVKKDHETAASLKKAAVKYADAINSSSDQLADASFVIKNKSRFSRIAEETVRRQLIVDGLEVSSTLSYLNKLWEY